MRILIINDDEFLLAQIYQSLVSQRHVVETAKDAPVAWQYVHSGKFELILLSLCSPKFDGIDFCLKMRSQGYTLPILLVTAKDAIKKGIQGLDAGADDYISQPLDISELNARVRALSRRKKVISNIVLDVNGLTLDPNSCQVSYRKKPIRLTAKEYNLLELFLRNPSRVYSRSQILDLIWNYDNLPSEESVKTHIKELRKKLNKAGAIDWIKNVYGMGYLLNPKVSQSPEYTV